jgi:hypothetical protein
MIAGLLGIISGAGLIALHIPAVIITVPVVLGFAAMIGDAEFLGTINQLLEQQVGAPKKRHQHLEGWVTLWIAAKDWPWSGRLRSLWALTGLVDYRTSHVDYLIHDVIRTAFEKLSELGEDDTESIDNQKLLDGYSELVRNNVGKLVNAYSRGRLASAIVLVTGGLWVMASLAVVYSQLR